LRTLFSQLLRIRVFFIEMKNVSFVGARKNVVYSKFNPFKRMAHAQDIEQLGTLHNKKISTFTFSKFSREFLVNAIRGDNPINKRRIINISAEIQ